MDKKQWETITREELMEIYSTEPYSDAQIAAMFGVTKGQVAYKRKKLNISHANIIFKNFINTNSELLQGINEDMKQQIINTDTSVLSRAIANYIFRNGPVENMHTNKQLSDNDMEILNKYMNDRIATIIYLVKENDWLRFALFLEQYKHYGSDWDEPKLQIDEIDQIKKNQNNTQS